MTEELIALGRPYTPSVLEWRSLTLPRLRIAFSPIGFEHKSGEGTIYLQSREVGMTSAELLSAIVKGQGQTLSLVRLLARRSLIL